MTRFLIILLLSFAALPFAKAHQVDSVELELLQYDGQWKLEGLLDIAYMLPESRGNPDEPPLDREDVMAYSQEKLERIKQEAERTMRRILELRYNEEVIPWSIDFPDFRNTPLELPEELGGIALMRAVIAVDSIPGPGLFEAYWNDEQNAELIIIIEEGLDLGLLSISSGMAGTLLIVDPAENGSTASTPSGTRQSGSWIISGFRHVIPLGLDHILFILGLFLLAPRWRLLLSQSLLFTLAHSITLALAIFGIIRLPSGLVEILIAASIAWIGIENLLIRKLKKSRLFLVFGFGLLHGLGFASVLGEKLGELTGRQVTLPLVSFNLGVEIAQITLLTAAFAVFFIFRKHEKLFRIFGSIAIAAAGIFWMLERIHASYFPLL